MSGVVYRSNSLISDIVHSLFLHIANYIIHVGTGHWHNGSGDLGSIPGWVIPKTQEIVLDAYLLNTQHYKVRIKGKVEQSRERSSAFGVVAIEKGASRSLLTIVTNFTFYLHYSCNVRVHVHTYTYIYIYIYISGWRVCVCKHALHVLYFFQEK